MPQFIITLSDEEIKALEWDIASIQEWIQNAISNKARQCIDKLVEQYDDRRASKISKDEKLSIIRNADIPKAIDRNVI
jgi:hypothetical protein